MAELARLLDEGHRVYVHCTAGLGRAPAVIIAYMHWLAGMSLRDAYNYTTTRRRCHPRVRLPTPPRLPWRGRERERSGLRQTEGNGWEGRVVSHRWRRSTRPLPRFTTPRETAWRSRGWATRSRCVSPNPHPNPKQESAEREVFEARHACECELSCVKVTSLYCPRMYPEQGAQVTSQL